MFSDHTRSFSKTQPQINLKADIVTDYIKYEKYANDFCSPKNTWTYFGDDAEKLLIAF